MRGNLLFFHEFQRGKEGIYRVDFVEVLFDKAEIRRFLLFNQHLADMVHAVVD